MSINWIAHRGCPEVFPENTLPGYIAAINAGARYIETDVQLTADGVPVLFHDDEMQRLCGHDGVLAEFSIDQLDRLSAHYPERFGQQFEGTRIPRLTEFVELLSTAPSVHAFVELKYEGSDRDAALTMTTRVLELMAPVINQCVLISFSAEVVKCAQEVSGLPVGWVLPAWNKANRKLALDLDPDYLFCNQKRLPSKEADFWRGDWEWVIYTVNDHQAAASLSARGFNYLETDRAAEMLSAQSHG